MRAIRQIRRHTLRLSAVIYFIVYNATAVPAGEAEHGSAPPVRLTLVLVPELVACKPAGYKSYREGEATTCENKWSPSSVGSLVHDHVYLENVDIPPDAIPLDLNFTEALETYEPCKEESGNVVCALEPAKRESVILLFRWEERQSSKFSLTREQRTAEGCYSQPIARYSVDATLDRDLHWINHQRADAFRPGCKSLWVLKRHSDGTEWRFVTRREAS